MRSFSTWRTARVGLDPMPVEPKRPAVLRHGAIECMPMHPHFMEPKLPTLVDEAR